MTYIQKLKATAEAAQQWSGEIGESRWYEADCFKQPYFSVPDATFIAAANPAAVLGLIAEIERLQAAKVTLERLGYCDKGGQLWKPPLGKKPDFDLIDHLRAENEELRKDAERYQWLRDNASLILDRKTAYQAETGFIKFDTMPARSETETAIDAAMSKEVDHG